MRLLSVVILTVAAAAGCQSASPSQSEPESRPSPASPPAGSSPDTGDPDSLSVAGLSQRKEPPLPRPRQELASAASDRLGLWVIGGYDSRGRSTPTVFRYRAGESGARGRWSRERDLPIGLNHPAAAVLGNTVYVAGGSTGQRETARVFALPGPRERAPLNHRREGLALVAVGEKLYAIGGKVRNKVPVGPAEEYDPRANKWTDLPPLPGPRDHVSGFAWQGKACVAGGRRPNTAKVHCWDPAARKWTAMPDLPAATSGAGGGTLGERVVVAGGEDPIGGTMVEQLAVFHRGSWTAGRMAVPRHGIALAPYRGRLWACGGATRAGIGTVADCTSIG
jgi:hypothetical protein